MVKALSYPEIKNLAVAFESLVGAQLQEVLQTERALGLGLYIERKTVWLWVDLQPRAPLALVLPAPPPHAKKSTKPLMLFARAHVVGQRLVRIETSSDKGRVIDLVFPHAQIELRLFPAGQNITVAAADKSVSFYRVKELAAIPEFEPILGGAETAAKIKDQIGFGLSPRSYETLHNEWMQDNSPSARPGGAGGLVDGIKLSEAEMREQIARKQWEKDLEKKRRALGKMQEDLVAKGDQIWRTAGEWLKAEGAFLFPQNVPSEFAAVLDLRATLSTNIEACFKKAKTGERKLEGTRARMRMLEGEIAKLSERGPALRATPAGKPKKTLLESAKARGRKLEVASDLEAYIGKSAADNLALLRRAQPFDYWLHLRDYPGAYAILRRTRSRIVTDTEFTQVGQWALQQSLGKNAAELRGLRFDLLIVECRFVRPIKGDKLGRVNYSNDRVLTIRG